MGHTPFGYRIENGIAVIDEDAAGKLRKLYENYLSGLSLKDAAAKAGIDTYHGTAKRLLKTQHYIEMCIRDSHNGCFIPTWHLCAF